jgi:NitT/TauT family transport system permease protein
MDAPESEPGWGRRALERTIAPVVAVIVWYILSRLVFVVPPPTRALGALVTMLATPHYRADIGQTLVKIIVAFSLSAILGLALGSLLGLSPRLRAALEPLMLIANGVPKIVFYPILLILFGLGGTSQVVMGVIFGTLPVLVNLMSALANMRPVYRKVARMLEVGPLRAFVRIYMPAVAPTLMVALQLGFSLSVLGVVYAELIASSGGLGQFVIETYSVGNYPMLAAGVLVIMAISLAGTGLLRAAERMVLKQDR